MMCVMHRFLVVSALAVAAVAGAADVGSTATLGKVGAPVCVTTVHRPCAVRPNQLVSGRRAAVRAIRWDSWGEEAAVGNGHLRVLADDHGPAGPITARGRVRLYHLKRCEGKLWYSRLTIRYGRGYERVYTHNAPRVICGRFPSTVRN
jgi:hypothetical protein